MPGRLARAIYPDIDFAIWQRQRNRAVSADLRTPAYARSLSRGMGASDADRPVRVVVVPQEGEDFESFRAGTRNFYYEAAQNLRELIGTEHVDVFSVRPGESPSSWHVRLLDHLIDTGATHLITHIEHDPGTAGASFTWDTFWTMAHTRWDGVLLGVMFDSAYEWILFGSRRLALMSDRYVIVDICMPMDGRVIRRRAEVGPVNMPISDESMALVDERLRDVTPQWDVSFIGVLYPYRQELIERLRAAGASVAVNPHRSDEVRDLRSSQLNQPGWLDYMAGLASSRMTLNFSRSSAGDVEQLKTRVVEAAVAGTYLLTDDRVSTRRWWVEGAEFSTFLNPGDLPAIVEGLLADPEQLAAATRRARERGRRLARTDFWASIDETLERRGLRRISSASLRSPTLHT